MKETCCSCSSVACAKYTGVLHAGTPSTVVKIVQKFVFSQTWECGSVFDNMMALGQIFCVDN